MLVLWMVGLRAIHVAINNGNCLLWQPVLIVLQAVALSFSSHAKVDAALKPGRSWPALLKNNYQRACTDHPAAFNFTLLAHICCT